MSALEDIQQTLEERLDSDGTLPTLKAWENFLVNPKSTDPWLRATFIPSGSTIVTLGGSKKVVEHRGLFVVDVFVKEGLGPGQANTYVSTIMDLFSPGQTIQSGAKTPVTLLRAERGRGQQSAPHYQVPVDISWYGYEDVIN